MSRQCECGGSGLLYDGHTCSCQKGVERDNVDLETAVKWLRNELARTHRNYRRELRAVRKELQTLRWELDESA